VSGVSVACRCGLRVAVPSELVAAESVVAACDVLVLRALELVGKRIGRGADVGKGFTQGRALRRDEGRYRYRRMMEEGRAWHEAHLLWRPDAITIDRGLEHAWDAVPVVLAEHGCCGATPGQLTLILDRYVRDLLLTGTGHAVVELRYRLAPFLGVEERVDGRF
jgi:hypothetical protein